MRHSFVVGAVLAMMSQASAQTTLTQPVANTYADIGNIRLPLPAGQWQPVRDTETQAYYDSGGLANTNTLHRLYIQTEGGRLAAMLVINTEANEASHGWRPPRLCSRTDTYWADNRDGWTNNYDCALVNHVVLREGERTAGLTKAAYDAARGVGGMPKQVIRAEIAEGRSKHYSNISVSFNPELAGFALSNAGWKTSEWGKGRADPAHAAYLDRVVAWTSAYRKTVRDALP